MLRWSLFLFGVGALSVFPFSHTRSRVGAVIVSGIWVVGVEILLKLLGHSGDITEVRWVPFGALLPALLLVMLFIRTMSASLSLGTFVYCLTLALCILSDQVSFLLLHALVGHGALEASVLRAGKKQDFVLMSRSGVVFYLIQFAILFLTAKSNSQWGPYFKSLEESTDVIGIRMSTAAILLWGTSLARICVIQFRTLFELNRSLQVFPLLIELWWISICIQENSVSTSFFSFIYVILGTLLMVLVKRSLDRIPETRLETVLLCLGSTALWILVSPWFEKGQPWPQWGQFTVLFILMITVMIIFFNSVKRMGGAARKTASQGTKMEAQIKLLPLFPGEAEIFSWVGERYRVQCTWMMRAGFAFASKSLRSVATLPLSLQASMDWFFVSTSFQGRAVVLVICLVAYFLWSQSWNFISF